MPENDLSHELSSLTVMVYVLLDRPLKVLVAKKSVPLIEYRYAGVPPDADTAIEPSLPPLHCGMVGVSVADILLGCVTVWDIDFLHPLASVTVAV
ncbi:hypothetical protein DSECCO2_204330 [anaerobic digester metagenome]